MQAATFSTIAGFPASDDGVYPDTTPAAYGKTLYGTTYSGGRYFSGTIYKVNPATGTTTTVYSFPGATGGTGPNALLKVGRLLYGTTASNFPHTDGTVFSFDPSTGIVKTLYSFSGQDGNSPNGRLTDIDGVLYGATASGGTFGYGVVFKYDPVSGTETTLHALNGSTDGEYPSSALERSGHFLYGTAQYGGSSTNDGTLFKIDVMTGKETVLHSFTGTDGAIPDGNLVVSGGIIYGSTSYGGANGWGSAYSYAIKSGTEAVLHSFNYDANGFFPNGGLIDVGGVLYGTTSGGPSPSGGTIFSIDVASNVTTTIHAFAIGGSAGSTPESALLDVDGLLYGATGSGGIVGGGTVFKFDPSSAKLTDLHDFAGVTPGQYVNGSLLQVGHLFYGTTPRGGAAILGGIFKLDPASGKMETLFHFDGGSMGYNPLASLITVGDALFGTTSKGNLTNEAGTVFSFDKTTRTLTTIFSFDSSGPHGASAGAAYPNSALLDVGGILYGTTSGLGAGTVYNIVPTSGQETTLSALPGQGYGEQPPGSGLLPLGGLLYGTSFTGGANNEGSVFSTVPSTGATSLVYSFQNAADGAHPEGGLVAVNGILYGTATTGGARYNGTLFSLDPSSGKLTTLHPFSAYGDGTSPSATLLNIGGVLYGTTMGGGAAEMGTIFSYDIDTGVFTTLYSFTGEADGSAPQAALIDADGVLYGTTSLGGAFNRGTAFSLVP